MINVGGMSGYYSNMIRQMTKCSSTVCAKRANGGNNNVSSDKDSFISSVSDQMDIKNTDMVQDRLSDNGVVRQKKSGHIQETLKQHPDWTGAVTKHIYEGEGVKKAYPPNKPTDEMTMEEYKEYITGAINSIPIDPSHYKDDMAFNISEEGWETMKDDPEYESWVLGQIHANLTFHNPWASYPGWTGNYSVDNFGASIEEHHGVGIGKSAEGSKDWFEDNSKDSFWSRRSKNAEIQRRQDKKIAEKKELQKKWQKEAIEKHHQYEDFLNGKTMLSANKFGAFMDMVSIPLDYSGLAGSGGIFQAFGAMTGMGIGML